MVETQESSVAPHANVGGQSREQERHIEEDAAKNLINQFKDDHLRRRRRASSFEFVIVSLILYSFLLVKFLEVGKLTDAVPANDALFLVMRSLFNDPIGVGLIILTAAEMFMIQLTKNTIIVNLATKSLPDFKINDQSIAPYIDTISANTQSISVSTNLSAASADEVEKCFRSMLRRSRSSLNDYSRRPNALLMVGGFVALLGLAFFFFTLPSTAVLPSEIQQKDLMRMMIDISPRLLMLLFIQILAGFFLKQHRAAIEDFRYYESIHRLREDMFASYLIKKNYGNKQDVSKITDELLKDRRLHIIKKGEILSSQDVYRSEANEMQGLAEKLLNLIKTEKKAADKP